MNNASYETASLPDPLPLNAIGGYGANWRRDLRPFHISRNELTLADMHRDNWQLIRVWNFAREPRAFEIRPPLDAHVSLTPTSFLAALR